MANILIVDDSMLMRKNLKSIFLKAGHNVVSEASNGIQAISEYDKCKPDIVTMDVTMPILNGIETLKRIKSSHPEAKIIMVTSLEQKSLAFEALENGASHYIIKPVTEDKVLSIMDEVLKYDPLISYVNAGESKEKALNDMWFDIKQSSDEIIDLNKSLEQRVEERTDELETANHKLKETVAQLKETQEQLIQTEKAAALSGMVAGVAHEINTPVGVGLTATSLLEEKTSELKSLYRNGKMKKSDFEEYLQINEETVKAVMINLNRASELIRSFKQLAVDQSRDEKRKFNVMNYIKDIILSLRPELKKTKIKVEVEGNELLEIYSFPGAFSQIITNLVMNSLIHAYVPGDEGIISIKITEGDGEILLEFTDDGKGIPTENIDKIFNPFFTTRRGRGGTGLGLNIVYNLVTNTLGGSIRCESDLGKGTEFIIKIRTNLG